MNQDTHGTQQRLNRLERAHHRLKRAGGRG